MRIFVAGRSGQLARALAVASAEGMEIRTIGRPEIDITQPQTVAQALEDFKPDAIINAAAYTAVDKAEDEEDVANAVNLAAAHLATEALKRAIPFVHVSTDYVFDGTATIPYREDDLVSPLGAYGRSKRAAEIAVLEAHPASLVVRTSWVFHHEGANFVRTMLRLAETRDTVSVVADQFGSPTYAQDLAEALIAITRKVVAKGENAPRGLFHATGSGITSWHQFATAIFEESAKKGGPLPRVVPIPTSGYPTRAQRPAYSALDCSRLMKVFGLQLPEWRDGLERCICRLFEPKMDN